MNNKLRILALALTISVITASSALAQPVSGVSTTEFNEGADKAAAFYNPVVVNNISLTLPQSSVDALNNNPYTTVYQPASVTITTADGIVTSLSNIGVRLKGQATRTNLYGKAPLKLKFDAFVTDQKFMGLTRMTLNSMAQDPSFVHEATAYRLYRAMGVIAPRTTYSWVTLNGADFGLYMNVESVDSQMLKRWVNPVHLYSSNCYNADITYYQSGCYDTNYGDTDRTDLNAAVAVSVLDGQDWWTAVNKVADMNAVINLMGTDIYTSNWDGYTDVVQNNYYMVFDVTGKLRIIPWGQDGAFPQDSSAQLDWLGQGPAFRNWGNGQRSVMLRKCVAYDPCQKLLVRAEASAKAKAEQLGIPAFKNRLATLLNDTYVAHETRANADVNSARYWQNWLDQFFPMRTQALTAFLGGRAPEAPDVSLNGSATVGSTLTAVGSTWDFTARLSYSWLRDGQVIPNQTANTYTLTPQDNAHLIAAVVSANKGSFPAAKTSSQAILVAGYVSPKATLSGDNFVGGTLNANPLTDTNINVSYRWFRSGKAITNALSSSYVITPADLQKDISVTATILQPGYPKAVSTSSSVKIVAGNMPVPSIQINGTAAVGNALTVTANTTDPLIKTSYQWTRDGVAIPKATRSNYTLTGSDVGRLLTAQLTLVKVGFNNIVASAVPVTIREGTMTKSPDIFISGAVKVGKSLNAVTGMWDNQVVLKYQWFRNGTAIQAATSKSYKVTQDDLSSELTLSVTATKTGYTAITKVSLPVSGN